MSPQQAGSHCVPRGGSLQWHPEGALVREQARAPAHKTQNLKARLTAPGPPQPGARPGTAELWADLPRAAGAWSWSHGSMGFPWITSLSHGAPLKHLTILWNTYRAPHYPMEHLTISWSTSLCHGALLEHFIFPWSTLGAIHYPMQHLWSARVCQPCCPPSAIPLPCRGVAMIPPSTQQ